MLRKKRLRRVAQQVKTRKKREKNACASKHTAAFLPSIRIYDIRNEYIRAGRMPYKPLRVTQQYKNCLIWSQPPTCLKKGRGKSEVRLKGVQGKNLKNLPTIQKKRYTRENNKTNNAKSRRSKRKNCCEWQSQTRIETTERG